MPYINAHRGKTFVIMLSGEAIAEANFVGIINDIALLHSTGIRLVVVYGARPQIDTLLREQRCDPRYHKQIRITDARTLALVKQAAGRSAGYHRTPVDEPEQYAAGRSTHQRGQR